MDLASLTPVHPYLRRFRELRWMREAMAEQRAELVSFRAENRLLRAEVARRAENEPCGSDDDDA